MLMLAGACQKSVAVNGQDVKQGKTLLGGATQPATATGTPVLIPGGIVSDRGYYQTRSAISLQLSNSAVQVGDTFTLVDTQSGAKLVDHQAVVAPTLDLATDPAAAASSYELILKLYPGTIDDAGKFVYGDNDLVLQVDGSGERTANLHIVLHDFPWLAMQLTHFGSNVQQSGGLQGELSAYHTPVVSNGKQNLTTGSIATLNR